jgi:nitrogen fixation protein NifB
MTATEKMPGLDFSQHPCFSQEGHHKFGRLHLPVAPRCNLQCNFCNRKYDCVNESRPGVTSTVLSPDQAAAYFDRVVAERPEISVAGIAGPGDPFANPAETMATLRLIRKKHPKMLLCVASNGLGIGPYIDELASLKTSHVTLTICAIDPEIGAKIYAWVRDGAHPVRGVEGAALLLSRQLAALVQLKERGLTVKVNSIILPGINDEHLLDVAAKVSALGADIMNCMPMVTVKGAAFEHLAPPDTLMAARVRLQSERYLPQMTHCARCRADAVGYIGEPMTSDQHATLQQFAHMNTQASVDPSRPYVAVATLDGTRINQHLGEAGRLAIFEQDAAAPGNFRRIAVRWAPESSSGDARWNELADTLKDCQAILVTAAGPKPEKVLAARGLKVVQVEGRIGEGLKAVFGRQPLPPELKRQFTGCDAGLTCHGDGERC